MQDYVWQPISFDYFQTIRRSQNLRGSKGATILILEDANCKAVLKMESSNDGCYLYYKRKQ